MITTLWRFEEFCRRTFWGKGLWPDHRESYVVFPSLTRDLLSIFAVSNIITMKINEIEVYQSPKIEITEALYEGIVCASNENLDETEGEW